MEIRHKEVSALTPVEYRACYNANYGYDGYMREELQACKEGAPGRVIMLWDGPDDTVRSLIGWALLTPVRLRGLTAGSVYTKRVSKWTCQFWVKSRYRKKGHGKTLMDEVTKLDPRPHVFPHDEASGALFADYKITASVFERTWVTEAKKKKAKS